MLLGVVEILVPVYFVSPFSTFLSASFAVVAEVAGTAAVAEIVAALEETDVIVVDDADVVVAVL